jgi:hypothetical protein
MTTFRASPVDSPSRLSHREAEARDDQLPLHGLTLASTLPAVADQLLAQDHLSVSRHDRPTQTRERRVMIAGDPADVDLP